MVERLTREQAIEAAMAIIARGHTPGFKERYLDVPDTVSAVMLCQKDGKFGPVEYTYDGKAKREAGILRFCPMVKEECIFASWWPSPPTCGIADDPNAFVVLKVCPKTIKKKTAKKKEKKKQDGPG